MRLAGGMRVAVNLKGVANPGLDASRLNQVIQKQRERALVKRAGL
jgi:hypothetical protein